jgi:hypothetical protein
MDIAILNNSQEDKHNIMACILYTTFMHTTQKGLTESTYWGVLTKSFTVPSIGRIQFIQTP